MPEISVVMPVYNGERYLPTAIESILGQTFGDFEFLMVCEHGSNAASMEIMERYAAEDPRIRLIRNTERLGIAASLNVGLDAAVGKYIARMDADDISGPRRFEVQKLFLDTYPDIGACGTAHRVVNSPKWVMDYLADPEQIESDMLFFIPMRHPTAMLRGALRERCRYDETLMGGEEYDYFYKLSRVTKLSNILDPSLFTYRRTDENASKRFYERDVLIRRETQRGILREKLALDFDSHQMDVLNFVGSSSYRDLAPEQYQTVLEELEQLLERIERQNEKLGVYRPDPMLRTLRHRWYRESTKLNRIAKGAVPEKAAKRLHKGRYASVKLG